MLVLVNCTGGDASHDQTALSCLTAHSEKGCFFFPLLGRPIEVVGVLSRFFVNEQASKITFSNLLPDDVYMFSNSLARYILLLL